MNDVYDFKAETRRLAAKAPASRIT